MRHAETDSGDCVVVAVVILFGVIQANNIIIIALVLFLSLIVSIIWVL